ncbi:MAG: competence/damage-inducible protein A [Anaerolineae bacterium]|nr:competence/damage-inducible protein A [Anaerolineae bacterium]
MNGAVLLAIGNELLNGEVQDRNLYLLARELTRLGWVVEEAAIVRDDPERIAALCVQFLQRGPQLLVVSGGLGPTDDDLTLAAVAEALGRPLQTHPSARDMVEAHYDRLLALGYVPRRGPLPARVKMATLPQGAIPLPNPIGVAPGVLLEHQDTLVVCLPGVPAELEAIFAASLRPLLTVRFHPGIWVEEHLVARCEDEADVTLSLRTVAARYPDLYFKSLARPFPEAQSAELTIVVAARAEDAEATYDRVQMAKAALETELARAGIPVIPALKA